MKITKKNILFFILGFLTYFAIDIYTDWEATKKAFTEGVEDARNNKEYNYTGE